MNEIKSSSTGSSKERSDEPNSLVSRDDAELGLDEDGPVDSVPLRGVTFSWQDDAGDVR